MLQCVLCCVAVCVLCYVAIHVLQSASEIVAIVVISVLYLL